MPKSTKTTSKNANLHSAKRAKNDEFYTQLCDIESELGHYRPHFKGKTVLCNCDDPFESNFFKYFVLNFNTLGLKKLIATCYAGSPIAGTQLDLFAENQGAPARTPYKTIVTEVYDATGDGAITMDDVAELFRQGRNELTQLQGDGDFRSPECLELLDEADIVVTNPPFSLFREYVHALVERDKKFIVVGNKNAVTYKEIFPLIKENKLWIGNRSMNQDFWLYVDESNAEKFNSEGRAIRHIMACWFTNLDIKKRHEELTLVKRYHGHEADYPKYDNYDAINVDKVKDIPEDYDGVMGVPITFLDKYCPDQFEIVAFRKGNDGKDLVFTREREREYNRTFESLSDSEIRAHYGSKAHDLLRWKKSLREDCDTTQAKLEPIDIVYPSAMSIPGCMNSPKDTQINGKKKYARILIRRK